MVIIVTADGQVTRTGDRDRLGPVRTDDVGFLILNLFNDLKDIQFILLQLGGRKNRKIILCQLF